MRLAEWEVTNARLRREMMVVPSLRRASASMAFVAAVWAQPVGAVDIGKALQRPVTASFSSPKKLYDIERCIVLLDGPGGPTVLRQPDRPNEEMIAYIGNGMAVINVITLKQDGETVKIEDHENHGLAAGVLRKAPQAIESCI